MIAVIIAGGSGTRLWPLSTSTKPKHLMRVGSELSLLQESYERAKLFAEEIYVVTDSSHAELVKGQLQDLEDDRVIVEPDRRGTASCNVLALSILAEKYDADTKIGFIHADHHIRNREGFAETVRFAADVAATQDKIGLIGIYPDYPSTGFGYIKVGDRIDGAFKVLGFKEKPSKQVAQEYVESGEYLWNLGLFTAPIRVFERELKKHNKTYYEAFQSLGKLDSEARTEAYLSLPNEPIETELIEKLEEAVVVPGTFDWADVGSFRDLYEVMPNKDVDGNVVRGDSVQLINTTNSVVMSHDKPVAVIGLDNVAVIDTPDGLLVCHKDHAQEVKIAAKNL